MEIMQPFSLSDVMFEVFSAMGTVGMSAGITRDVCMASRMVLVFLMFCGRIRKSDICAFIERAQT